MNPQLQVNSTFPCDVAKFKNILFLQNLIYKLFGLFLFIFYKEINRLYQNLELSSLKFDPNLSKNKK
jgi:hypothetical protein